MLVPLQVTRSIGDFYLKLNEFQRPPLMQRFLLPNGLKQGVLSAEPSITSHALDPSDRFAIFASDGLWDHMKPAEACSLVARFPRAVSTLHHFPSCCLDQYWRCSQPCACPWHVARTAGEPEGMAAA